MDTRRIKIAAILLFSAALIGMVLASSINQNGLSGFTWYNGTNLWVDDIYRGGTNFTAWIDTTFYQEGDVATFTTIDTGQGANELFDMDQNLETGSAVTFSTLDTGQGANELYDMNQDVETTDDVTFVGVSTDWIELGGVNRTGWPSGSGDFDQSVNTTDDVTFNTVTATTSITLDGDTRTTWPSFIGTGNFNALPFDHIFYNNGTHYLAIHQDGSNSSNTNFATLFNAVESANDWMYFSSGIYTVTAGLDLNSGSVHMEGSGYQSCKFDASGLGDHMITITSGSNMIEGIELDGNNVNFNGIHLNGDYEDNQIIQSSIHDFDGHGIYMLGSVETNSNKVIECKVKSNGDSPGEAQIYLGDAIGHYLVKDCVISDNAWNTSETIAIYVGYGGQGVISGNFIWGFYQGIVMYSTENHIIGPDNTFTGCGTGIVLAGSNYDVMITGNMFWSNNYDGVGEYSTNDRWSDIWASTGTNSRFNIAMNSGDGASHTRSFLYVTGNSLSTSLVHGNLLANYDTTEIQPGGGSVTVVDNL